MPSLSRFFASITSKSSDRKSAATRSASLTGGRRGRPLWWAALPTTRATRRSAKAAVVAAVQVSARHTKTVVARGLRMRSLDLGICGIANQDRGCIALKFLPANHSQTESFVVHVEIAPFTDRYSIRSLEYD